MKTEIDPARSGWQLKAGAALFLLWAVLHIWVGLEGLVQRLTGTAADQWNMLIGGDAMPRAAFQHASDPATLFAQSQLLVNFCIDVGGYGILALWVAYALWKQRSWQAYWIGVVVIGIGDLAFLFSLLLSGVIEANAGTIGGPVLWLMAVLITPFGLKNHQH